VLAAYLCSSVHLFLSVELQTCTVLELGIGRALQGQCWRPCFEAALSPILRFAKANIALHAALNVQALELDWCRHHDVDAVFAALSHRLNVVLAADVIYDHKSHTPLLSCDGSACVARSSITASCVLRRPKTTIKRLATPPPLLQRKRRVPQPPARVLSSCVVK
jgi:predicted nicotinamide N-methyase